MEGAEPPDEVAAVDGDDGAAREEALHRRLRLGVGRVVEGGQEDDAVAVGGRRDGGEEGGAGLGGDDVQDRA